MRVGQKVTVEVNIHDWILNLRPNGVGSRHLRHDLWAIFWKISHQESINEPELGRMIKFKFKKCYKIQRAAQQKTLDHLQIERLSRALSVVSQVLINPLSLRVHWQLLRILWT